MLKKKLIKRLVVLLLWAVVVYAGGSSVYASTQEFPDGTITDQNGTKYLIGSRGEKYSGWFNDSKGDWYYFNESGQVMETGWHHDIQDGYWYYLNLSDGKMETGWQTIDGKEYFFQPERNMGNYHFDKEQEKWLYSGNHKTPYGGMYIDAETPDGNRVDSKGQVILKDITNEESFTGTYRTELGHAGGGSQEFAITIKKVENHKIWGAFSWGGDSGGCGYGEWNGEPIVDHKVQGTFYYAMTIPESYKTGKIESEFFKENFYLYFESDSLYFDLNFITNGEKIKLVRETDYPNDGCREQEYKKWLIAGCHT